ncbi:methylated-DNA--protein-cysteine methyltransferase [Fodinibius salicampi]|uniref:methylated-DNA--[protein]-cysteine S-methyltransferase n=1 Tax=Fodinibius salicampi TaxID=1920655 RepID=UPI002577AA23|nr:methylated-DNA--[protein]-cysteine S-methyltransferase [Fodinibius salicampi]
MKYHYHSPIGWLELVISNQVLTAIRYLDNKPDPLQTPKHSVFEQAANQLTRYFNKKDKHFTMPISTQGTAFQKTVWEELQNIPFGTTITYGELAKRLGDPNKVRAVGRANGKNPIPIIIPCHRVIGSDKKLIGYAGGIERKRFLLEHEGAILL